MNENQNTIKKIKWSICDDEDCFCYIYRNLLKDDAELEFSGSCCSADACFEMLCNFQTDVLLLDVQMESDTSGIDIIPLIKNNFPKIKIIILTSYLNEDYIYTAFANGADGYLLKDNETEMISKTIKETYNNISTVSPQIAQILTKKTQSVETGMKSILFLFEIISKLSPAEYEILKSIYNGQTYKEIALNTYKADSTIRNHISRILKKFNYHSIKELVAVLREIKIFDYLS